MLNVGGFARGAASLFNDLRAPLGGFWVRMPTSAAGMRALGAVLLISGIAIALLPCK